MIINNWYCYTSILFRAPSGRKQVYSKKTENGDMLYMSVEDLALSHYKSIGFSNGDCILFKLLLFYNNLSSK